MKLLDRLSEGFGKLGKAAGQALDETRIQMDIMRVRKRKDGAARDLGYLVFRVSQGASAIPGEQDALVQRIADIEKEIDGLERQLREVRLQSRGEGGTPPAPPSGEGSAGAQGGSPEPPQGAGAAEAAPGQTTG